MWFQLVRGVVLLLLSFISVQGHSAPNLVSESSQFHSQKRDSLELGLSINNTANKYGIGFDLARPIFSLNKNDVFEIRLYGNYSWLNKYEDEDNVLDWEPFGSLRLGGFAGTFLQGTRIYAYGGGGVLVSILTEKTSTEKFAFGGFGLIGFNFYFNRAPAAIFIEFGGMGSNARANQVDSKPSILSGFLSSWGFRILL